MTNLENKMEFQPTHARVWFQSDEFEEEYDYVEVSSGHELDEVLRNYYLDYTERIFEGVYYATLTSIEYGCKSEDIDFKMSIGMDDAPNIRLSFKTDKLKDFNAKRLSLIRDIIDYDSETENVLLKKLVETY